ncbi:MAG: CoA transferase, partial [Candidatus Tectomicrobia bacterium]|nr:CoA transferase [Candidatus Tectomicrobia bacterium]
MASHSSESKGNSQGASPGGGPLEGLRVLDLGEAFAGPLGASLLGEFGAEVIKVEPPGIGNNMRSFPPFSDGVSLWWALEGRNKRSLTVDMRREKGQEIIRRLVRISDVVVENFRPGTLERWNLGYEELRRLNEGIVLFRATGFGQEGPYSHLPSYDTVGSAMGGLTYLTGTPDRPPLRTGLSVCDYLSASFNALGILLSLYNRGKMGVGQWAELGQYEVIFRLSGPLAAAYDRLGLVPERTGNQHPWVAPYGIFETREGRWVAVAAVEDPAFARLAEAMGEERLLRQPRYVTLAGRAEG